MPACCIRDGAECLNCCDAVVHNLAGGAYHPHGDSVMRLGNGGVSSSGPGAVPGHAPTSSASSSWFSWLKVIWLLCLLHVCAGVPVYGCCCTWGLLGFGVQGAGGCGFGQSRLGGVWTLWRDATVIALCPLLLSHVHTLQTSRIIPPPMPLLSPAHFSLHPVSHASVTPHV